MAKQFYFIASQTISLSYYNSFEAYYIEFPFYFTTFKINSLSRNKFIFTNSRALKFKFKALSNKSLSY